MKRILSWALTVMMLIGCFGSFAVGTASAATVDTSNPISITQWQDPTGTIKAGFGVLVPSNTSTATVEFVWQGGYYTATVGTEAFTSVDDARMAGKTQLIMPALNYSKVDITGSIELYGNHYGISPNAIPEDRTKDWTKSTDWKNDVTRVTGNINISKAAAPTSSRGTNIVIDGIRLDGFFMDNVRPVSKYATSIRMSNIMFSFSKSTTGTHHVIDLETELARLETDDVINNDTFIVENSRFDFVTSSSSTRVFDEDSPRTVIVNNNYFAEGFPRLGWFKQRTNVKEGYLEVSNNYFKKGGSIIHFCADINYSEASNSDIKSVAKFNNNVVYEVIEGALVITPSAFVSTEVSGNVFIDTKNLHKHPISVYIYKDAMKGVNYADVLTVKGNRFIGVSDHLMLNDGTTKLADDNANYYAMYTEDFANGQGDGRMYGALEGNDYYLDFNASVLASDAVMQADREGMSVYAKGNTASIIIAKDETYVPALKTVKGVPFALFTDKNYASAVSAVTADDVKGGRVYYAKAVTETNVVIEYKVVISAGDKNAPAYEDGYLLYDKTADMPVGAKFVATYKGNEYTLSFSNTITQNGVSKPVTGNVTIDNGSSATIQGNVKSTNEHSSFNKLYIPLSLHMEFDVTRRLTLGVKGEMNFVMNREDIAPKNLIFGLATARYNFVASRAQKMQAYYDGSIGDLNNRVNDLQKQARDANDRARQAEAEAQRLARENADLQRKLNDCEQRQPVEKPTYSVQFDHNSSYFSKEEGEALKAFANQYAGKKLSLVAEASKPGDKGYNQALSERRLMRVIKALKDAGFAEEDLKPSIAIGAQRGIDSAEGRRVTITVE